MESNDSPEIPDRWGGETSDIPGLPSGDIHRNQCQPQLTQEKLVRGFGKNAGEWIGRVEISKEEIPGSKRRMHGNILIYSRL